MKQFVFAGFLTAASVVSAQDTMRVNVLNEAQVITNRAKKNTPIAYSNVSAKALERTNHGQDIPFLLSTLPGVVVNSDAGAGVGYTGISIRGTSISRINVTSNGIPLNDPESHAFYWVDTPDLASSLQDIQVQRGAGTSTNGAGAFGASINMLTESISYRAHASLMASYGSFNTSKTTVKLGSGLLNGHWALDGRFSFIHSDGYRDRAETTMGSYFTQATYLSGPTMIKLLAFGGKEQTYHAWDGISREQLKTDRKYNPNGAIENAEGKVVGFYKDQNDVYFQQHAQAHLLHRFNDYWKFSSALHYTYGEGYYEEYKNRRKLVEYGLKPFDLKGMTVKKSDLIRRKNLRNHFLGATANANYRRNQWDITMGAAYNYYRGGHYGQVMWMKNYLGELAPKQEYYNYTGRKSDANAFVSADYSVLPHLHLFADLQYRHIHYSIVGTTDKYNSVTNDGMVRMNVHENFDFFNPKVGFAYNLNAENQVYASMSVAQKEPMNDSYTEGYFNNYPKAERLFDYEAGYRYTGRKFEAGVNLYYMHYNDQLVKNGEVNEIGEAVMINVPKSYRMGVELVGAWNILPCLRWDANLSLSANKIKDYTAYLLNENWENLKGFALGDKTIAMSPSVTANSRFSFQKNGWYAAFTSQYVGRQYLDNMELKDNSLDAYFVNSIAGSYTFSLKGVKEITVGATVYNLFNAKYEANGYSQTVYDSATGKFLNDPRFYPMAGTNFLANVTIKF